MNCSDCPFFQVIEGSPTCRWATSMASHNIVQVTEEDCSRCLKQQVKLKRHWKRKKRDRLWNERPSTVNILAAKKIVELNNSGQKLQDVFNYIKNNRYFAHEQAVKNILFESRLIDEFVDLCEKFIPDTSLRNDFTRIGKLDSKSILDADEKRDFFKNLEKKLDTGRLIFDTKYPVWVEPVIKDVPKPTKKKCIITAVAGDKYLKMFNKLREGYERYAKKIGVDFVIINRNTQGWWGLEKFRTKTFAEAYDSICFIDGDICIQENSPNIFDIVPNNFVGIHDDWPFCLHKAAFESPPFHIENWRECERNWMIKSQVPTEKFEWEKYATLLNTGVVVTPNKFSSIWSAPTKPFPRNHCDEQFWVEYNIRKNNIPYFPLPCAMNFQYWGKCFQNFKSSKNFYFLHAAVDSINDNKEVALEDILESRYDNKP